VDPPGQRPGHPQDLAVGGGDDLQVHAVFAALAGGGRLVRGEAVDGYQRAVDHHVGKLGLLRSAQRATQAGGTS